MKTWFCKDTQKWVAIIPRAFWLGINDFYTGEKIYSDDDIYVFNKFAKKYNNTDGWEKISMDFPNDCRNLKFGDWSIPIIWNTKYYKFKKR